MRVEYLESRQLLSTVITHSVAAGTLANFSAPLVFPQFNGRWVYYIGPQPTVTALSTCTAATS